MASGFAYSGGRPRCFPHWQDFQKCYAGTDDPKSCITQYFDYFECLHHRKEQARTKQVEQEYLRQIDPIAKEDHKAADVLANGGSVGLGVVQQAQENQRKS
ncbi:hypothetical protein Ac2012v2_006485 [Leucoagaricus gongylophorus]